MRGEAKALAWPENMPNFEICWNRRRFQWRWRNPENAPLFIEAILLERVLLDGRPQLEIVARLATIDEDRTDEAAARDLFWREARCKLGKLRRLSPRDIWQVEIMLVKRIPKPQNRMRRNRRPFARARTPSSPRTSRRHFPRGDASGSQRAARWCVIPAPGYVDKANGRACLRVPQAARWSGFQVFP